MRVKYHLALSKDSAGVHHTSGCTDYELNFNMDEVGHYYAYEEYYTEREGLDTYLLFYTVSGKGYLKYGSKKGIGKRN